jgi:flagellar hook protein FlgE
MNDALSISRSGMQSAVVRLRNSAHNVANLSTPDFKNHRTLQESQEGGGSRATTLIDLEPREVSLANEFVEQSLASIQYKASVRVVKTELDLKGSLLDAFA